MWWLSIGICFAVLNAYLLSLLTDVPTRSTSTLLTTLGIVSSKSERKKKKTGYPKTDLVLYNSFPVRVTLAGTTIVVHRLTNLFTNEKVKYSSKHRPIHTFADRVTDWLTAAFHTPHPSIYRQWISLPPRLGPGSGNQNIFGKIVPGRYDDIFLPRPIDKSADKSPRVGLSRMSQLRCGNCCEERYPIRSKWSRSRMIFPSSSSSSSSYSVLLV